MTPEQLLEEVADVAAARRLRVEAHLHLPEVVAKMLARRWRYADVEELESIGYEYLWRLACSFRPENAPNGEAGFGPYAVKWMLKSVNAEFTSRRRRNRDLVVFNLTDVEPAGWSGYSVPEFDEEAGRRHVDFRSKYIGPPPSNRIRRDMVPEAKARFAALYAEGLSYQEMGRILQLTPNCLRKWRTEMGLPLRAGYERYQ